MNDSDGTPLLALWKFTNQSFHDKLFAAHTREEACKLAQEANYCCDDSDMSRIIGAFIRGSARVIEL